MKHNPSKQQLIDFINQTTSKHIEPIKKIEDLSTGIHYLLLLNQMFPGLVKIPKINLKAIHQYESIINLKLLAIYISQINASFTFQLTKIAQKNYQDNLNLIKNLHKLYQQTIYKKQKEAEENQNPKQLTDQENNQKLKPKIIIKGPPKEKKQIRKIIPSNDSFKDIMNQVFEPIQQLKKIMFVVQPGKNQQDQAPQVKLNKIKKILGLSVKKINNQNFSVRCSGSKSDQNSKNQLQIDYPKLSDEMNLVKTEYKNLPNGLMNTENHFDTELKNLPKKFNCEQIKESMFKRYQLRQTSYRNNAEQNRKSRPNLDTWIKQEEEDTRYNQNLLSPGPQNDQNDGFKQANSRRKSIIRKSQSSLNLSKQKLNSVVAILSNKKSVHFSPKQISERNSQMNSSKKPSRKKKISGERKSTLSVKSPRS